MIVIIDCESIIGKTEIKINNENVYHLVNYYFAVLHLWNENGVYFGNIGFDVVWRWACTSAYGNPHWCYGRRRES
jgi:hypothetical protein